MRFAYIDSQGKEVAIPSVEALQLRIELGAIGESTMLFDAQGDRWAAAGEHEIFRTLARELDSREGDAFVPPPPPAASEPSASPRSPAPGGGGRARAPDPFEMLEGPASGEPGSEAAAGEEGAGSPESEANAGGSTEAWESAEMDEPAGAPAAPDPWDLPAVSDEPEPEGWEEGAGGDFDLGDFGTLDLAESLDEVSPPGASPPRSGQPQGPEPAPAGDEDGLDAGFGLDLEPSFAEQHDVPPAGDVDAPGAEGPEDADEPPPWWLSHEEPGPVEEAGERTPEIPSPEDAGAAAAPPGVPGDAPRERPPRSRPEVRPPLPPRRPRARTGRAIWAVFGVVVLAGAGWYGWRAFGPAGDGGTTLPDTAAVPAIDPVLEPAMRDLQARAYDATLDSLVAMADARDLPEEPDPDWLSGVYLARASRFADVEAYWQALADFLRDARTSEEAIFRAELEPLVDGADLEDAARGPVRARAVAGFRASAPERATVYDDFDALTAAALDLHRFLLGNEANIRYSPAQGGLSSDPVTEAVPATPQLGEELWDRVGRIPDALDALGALDRVNTSRLMELLVRKLDAAPLR